MTPVFKGCVQKKAVFQRIQADFYSKGHGLEPSHCNACKEKERRFLVSPDGGAYGARTRDLLTAS